MTERSSVYQSDDTPEVCVDGFHSDECPCCGMTADERDRAVLAAERREIVERLVNEAGAIAHYSKECNKDAHTIEAIRNLARAILDE